MRCARPAGGAGGHLLRQKYPELSEFQNAGVGVVSEILLYQNPQAEELRIVGLEVHEIGRNGRPWRHRWLVLAAFLADGLEYR